jgi:hypothetical protein
MHKMFMIESVKELEQFVLQNNLKEGIEWQVRGDRVWFSKQLEAQKEIPSSKIINLALEYATELNRII